MASPLDNIIRELTELITELYEFLLRTEGMQERPGFHLQLEQYTKKTLLIRLLAGQSDRIGLHDACMQQQDYLRALIQRELAPTPHEWDRLERWPLLLLPCLMTPVLEEAVDELITYVKNNTCALPFSAHDAQSLRANLLAPLNASENNILTLSVLRAVPEPHLSAGNAHDACVETSVRYLLQHELLDTVTEYLNVADRPETSAAEHAQALRLCADRIQLLGISAAASELIGLMDCCLLCHDALIKRLNVRGQLGPSGRAQIKIWADLLARYLDAPGSAETVEGVLEFYQRGQFIPSMLACEYDSLREFLLINAAARAAPRVAITAVPERAPSAQIVTLPFLLSERREGVSTAPDAAAVLDHTVVDGSEVMPQPSAQTEPVQELDLQSQVVIISDAARVPPVDAEVVEDAPQHALPQLAAQDSGHPTDASDADVQPPSPQSVEPMTTPLDQPTAVTAHSVAMLRVPVQLIDTLMHRVNESMVIIGQVQERLRLSMQQSKVSAEQNALLQQRLDELEQCVEDFPHRNTQDALEAERHHALQSVTRRMVEAATDARDLSRQLEDHLAVFGALLPALARVSKDSQEAVVRARMLPVSSIVARLQRSVRLACRTTGKQAQLITSGVETLLDSSILDGLIDPLLHLLRNAVEHGIESSAARQAAGKPDIGIIDLSFTRDGDHLLVRCCDDGVGLDYTHIQQVAAQKGLLEPGQQTSHDELHRVILLPGFATYDTHAPTPEQGRGLGNVNAQVLRLKGVLTLASVPQHGCSITLRVPLTLMSIHALLVPARTQVLAISSRGIEQILDAGAGQVRADGERLSYQVGKQRYDAYEIERLLHLPLDCCGLERGDRPVLLVRDHSEQLRAVFVQQVLARQNLVVKPLGPYLPTILGIEGATILGDGSVAAVVDLPGLLQSVRLGPLAPWVTAHRPTHPPSSAPLALVVDNSASARRALSEAARSMGFDVVAAIDGVAALEAINKKIPDLVLTDLDLPRLNGLELTEQVRALPDTRHLPIVMISARSTQKHRALALNAGVNLYLTKPFSVEHLAEQLQNLTSTLTES